MVQLWREAAREHAMRRAVYEKMIRRGEMSVNDARDKIALMEAIEKHFKPLAEAEEAVLAQEREKQEPRML
jgi:hypothetical protein